MLPVPFTFFYLHNLLNILEITRGKNILLFNPSQKLQLVVKNLELEVIQL